ncbi:hypothetical protein GGX14DRAFT_655544 [Mycena pura]|uniref:Uncharacterized protein n=1 Tax=Mycena pura TaxID=153505 RepID=A0AAD6V3X9_9AGAR|nr:hypothetical protein GGX14DRAFT_655544 [Mycena pura]
MAINGAADSPAAADAVPSPAAADAVPSPAATPPFDAANVDTTPPVPLVDAAAPVGATPMIAVSLSVPNPADLADPDSDSNSIPTPEGIEGESEDEGGDEETSPPESCPSIVRMVDVMKSIPAWCLHLALLLFLAILPDVSVNRCRGYELAIAHDRIPSGVWQALLVVYALILFYTSATFRHPLKTLPLGTILTFVEADRLRRISPKSGFYTV